MGREPFNPYWLIAAGITICIAITGSSPKESDFTSKVWIYTMIAAVVILLFYIDLRIHYNKLSESVSVKNKIIEKPTTVQNYITINTSDGSHHTTNNKPETKQNP